MVGTRLLVAVVLAEGVLLVAVLLSVAGWVAGAGWRRRRDGHRLADQRRILGAYLAGAAPPEEYGRRLARLPWRLRIRLLVDVARMVEGADRASMRTLAAEAGVLDRAERWCGSRRWFRRLAGARLLGVFGAGGGVVLALLADRRPEVRAQAAELAADHPEPAVVSRLLEMLADPAVACRFAVSDSLLRLGGVVVDPLADFLTSRTGRAAAQGLRVAASLPDARLLPAALRCCADEAAEVRAAAALLAAALGGPEASAGLLRLLADPQPEVRAAAACGLGRLSSWAAAPALARMLADPAWDVRKAAGLSLRRLGPPGAMYLRRALASSDALTVGMARQVLDLPEVSLLRQPVEAAA